MNRNKFYPPSKEYNLSKLPHSIISILTPNKSENILPYSYFTDSYDKVVLFLIDGINARHLQKSEEYKKFINIIKETGLFTSITCQFPSTTAANVTTIHTGLDIAQHGIYEWFYFEPVVDDIIAPILFSYAKDEKPETLENKVNPDKIYPQENVYHKLIEYGVKSFVFQDKEYIKSTYSNVILKGANIKGYESLKDGLETLKECISKEDNKAYYLFYYDIIDKISHEYGPGSDEFKEEIKILFEGLIKFQSTRNKDVLFILTSDHGQISLDPNKIIYLNYEFPEIMQYLKKSKSGKIIVSAGSARDLFLYVKEDKLDEVQKILQEKLYKKAVICKTSYLIEKCYFGDKNVSQTFISRLGNLVILPLDNWVVWWYTDGDFKMKGHHGGLSRDEMEIPLLIWKGQE